MSRNIRLDIEYDGGQFHGWQVQPKTRTVQGELEEALGTILHHSVSLTGAGRTDSGVHATGQVANFRTDSEIECHILQKGVCGVTGMDVVVTGVSDVADDFHSRFSAKARRYIYRIKERPVALERHTVWSLPYRLQLEPVNQALEVLIGNHDMASFCERKEALGRDTRVELKDASVVRMDGEIRFEFFANRFLTHMVRTIVGTLVDIGMGKLTAEEMARIIEVKDRRAAGRNAPAHGLCLAEVVYFLNDGKRLGNGC